jgi:hypothetical protein
LQRTAEDHHRLSRSLVCSRTLQTIAACKGACFR